MSLEDRRQRLVQFLESQGYIRTPDVRRAFLSVRREDFVPLGQKAYSYEDRPLPIGHGQTISAPSMIAIMLEVSELRRGMSVLEIGTGSGYNACLMAHMVGDGNVVSIERIPQLCEAARESLGNSGMDVSVVCADGTLGHVDKAPYDRIMITAASPGFPQPLIEQLKEGGKIIAPVGRYGGTQELQVGTKGANGKLELGSFGYCMFVPLIGKHGFKGGT